MVNERIDRVIDRLSKEGFAVVQLEDNPITFVVYPRDNPDAGSMILREWRGCVTPVSFEGELADYRKKQFMKKHIAELCEI